MIAPNKNSRENKIIAGSYKYKRVQVDYTSAVSRTVCTYMYLVVHETAAINCRVSHILVSPSFALCFRSCIARPPARRGGLEMGIPRGCPAGNPTLTSVYTSQLPTQLATSNSRRQPTTNDEQSLATRRRHTRQPPITCSIQKKRTHACNKYAIKLHACTHHAH